MNYYKKNREALLKKAYRKYQNEGGKEKAAKKRLRKKKETSIKTCQKMKST